MPVSCAQVCIASHHIVFLESSTLIGATMYSIIGTSPLVHSLPPPSLKRPTRHERLCRSRVTLNGVQLWTFARDISQWWCVLLTLCMYHPSTKDLAPQKADQPKSPSRQRDLNKDMHHGDIGAFWRNRPGAPTRGPPAAPGHPVVRVLPLRWRPLGTSWAQWT